MTITKNAGYKYKVVSAGSINKLHFKIRGCMNRSGWICEGTTTVSKDSKGRKIFQQAMVQQKAPVYDE